MTTSKIRVAVLQGGRSGEHEVSLRSAANVMQYLDRDRFSVIPITLHRDGRWQVGDDASLFSVASLFDSARPFDVVFPAVHGTFCEDGTLQGLLEQADVPYVGCGVLASSLAMDKDVSKRLAREAGIAVAPCVVLSRHAFENNRSQWQQEITRNLQLPLFVKPANTGSSVGIEKVTELSALIPALEQAFQYDNKVMIEQGIDATELEVAVLESPLGEAPLASVVGEIRPRHAFYSYAAKYLDPNGADLLVPADVDDSIELRVQALAAQIFVLFGCEGMARIDFFLERGSNRIVFNELNTLPGFTAISMYPRLMAASGVPYTELLSRLVDLALLRHQRQQKRQLYFPESQALLES